MSMQVGSESKQQGLNGMLFLTPPGQGVPVLPKAPVRGRGQVRPAPIFVAPAPSLVGRKIRSGSQPGNGRGVYIMPQVGKPSPYPLMPAGKG